MLIVTANHVSPDYASLIINQPFSVTAEGEARLDYRVGGDSENGYYASGPLLGCGKTHATPESAIRALLSDNGYTGIRIAPAEPEPAPQYERKVKAGGLVMVSATVEVEGLGPVEFERPCLWYLGRKAWHIDFSFTANGTRYFGTVWNRTREVELSGIYSSGTRLVAEAAKPEWRAALRKAAWPLIDAACKAYVDAIDNGDTKAAERVAMGLAPAEPAPVAPVAPVAPAEAETVQIKMTWQACLPLLLAVLESGTAEGRAMARDELARMARIADTACTEESI